MTDRFVGMRYCADTFDCADFVLHVRREMFGHEPKIGRRPRGARGVAELGELSRQHGTLTDAPQDGDLVLLRTGAGWHVGLWFFVNHMPHLLHLPAEGAESVLQPLHAVPMHVEGIYRWD